MNSKGNIPWNKGKHPSPETLKKLSDSHKGKHPSEESRRKTSESMKGKNKYKRTEETRRKMSESKRGKPAWNKGKTGIYSEETKKKIGLAGKDRIPWNRALSPSKETIEKQRESYRKTLLANPQIRVKIGLASKGKKLSEEHKRILLKSITGRRVSEETRIKIRESNLGKKRSEETRKKISSAGKGRPAWNMGVSPSEETIKKQMETHKKTLSNPEVRKKITEHSRERLLKMYESGTFPRQENTKPERKIKEELVKRGYKEGIDFIHQYRFMNKFMCDFCFPKQKVIVEADGDFWHANPKRYPIGGHLHQHQIKGIGRDKSKSAYITKVDNGAWTLLRFWESDIKEDVVKCVDKIEEALKKN